VAEPPRPSASCAVNLADWGTGLEYAPIVAISALAYLSAGVLERPSSVWPVVVGLLTAFVVGPGRRLQPVGRCFITARAVLVATGVAKGSLREPGLLGRRHRPQCCS
jgi:hypothetical protein